MGHNDDKTENAVAWMADKQIIIEGDSGRRSSGLKVILKRRFIIGRTDAISHTHSNGFHSTTNVTKDKGARSNWGAPKWTDPSYFSAASLSSKNSANLRM